jgi:hypothetical protein
MPAQADAGKQYVKGIVLAGALILGMEKTALHLTWVNGKGMTAMLKPLRVSKTGGDW